MAENLEKRYAGEAVRSKLTTAATVSAHMDAVMERRDELFALDSDDIERLARVLDATRLAANSCCTGG